MIYRILLALTLLIPFVFAALQNESEAVVPAQETTEVSLACCGPGCPPWVKNCGF